jgi:hypothetical protein
MVKHYLACLLAFIVITFSSCGPVISKSLFSVWTKDGTTNTLDLTAGKFDVFFTLLLTIASTGEVCSIDLKFEGDESQGLLYFNNGNGTCSTLNGLIDTYTNNGATLEFCPNNYSGACETYH